MNKRLILTILATSFSLASLAQQFRISEYDGDSVTIEYPPSFDGAYIFIEQSTNLAAQAWETVDYTQINLVAGAPVTYSTAADLPLPDGTATNEPIEIPYVMTPEYITAVANGEIENEAWTANSIWQTTKDGASGFFRFFGISFIDTDGDGVDNVTEYGNGTNPYTNDAPAIVLPADDGDPQLVPGSVNSAPGDWNTAPTTVYRNNGAAWQIINSLTLALDGTNGTFTEQASPEILGGWISTRCNGTWQAPASGFAFPTVDGGSFYRTESASFQWQGMEKIYPLAMTAYDGSEQFVNHLVQSNAADAVGLAVLENGTPVLVDASNPWTEEKVLACLKHLKTVQCRLQNVSGGVFDSSDTTAMAQAEETFRNGALTPKNTLGMPFNWVDTPWAYDIWQGGWYIPGNIFIISRNQQFTFLNSLQQHGFGPSLHVGYVAINDTHDWDYANEKWTLQASVSGILQTGMVCRTFQCSDGDTTWFVSGEIDHTLPEHRDVGYYFGLTPAMLNGGVAHHHTGYLPHSYKVLTTLDLPPAAGQTLVMDSDRDGTISTNDLGRVDESHPYRFWVNEDGNNAEFDEADIEDFFPALFIPPPDTSNVTFKLSANIDINYIQTTMTNSNSQEYLHDIDLAQTLAGQIQSLSTGNQTPITFSTNEVVLLAASEVNTNAHIMVHVLENGSETAVLTNYFSFSSITNMYRTQNIRANGTSTIGEPSNWPDDLTNGRDFVFVHGYNVSEEAGIGWNKKIFRRLWFAGNNARYHALLWDGTPNQTTWFDLGPYHYHNAVIHAFAAAPELADYLNSLNGPVVAAHSLGNMITGSAICDHNAQVSQYYALDAAVALEAYGDTTPNPSMVGDNLFDRMDEGLFSDLIPIWSDLNEYSWEDYPFESWSPEWYRLFKNDENDARGRLTWRHRFLDIQERTDVFNFYSSSEEVLRVDPDFTSFISGASSKYVWQIQENFKGRLNSSILSGIFTLGGAMSEYCGWGFTEDADSQHIHGTWGVFTWAPVRPRKLHEKLSASNPDREQNLDSLSGDPLFRPKPKELFGSNGAAYASNTVAAVGGSLDYNTTNDTYPIDNVLMTDWLLSKGFPSRTGPMGSAENSEWPANIANFDMADPDNGFMTNRGDWPNEGNNGEKEWWHSDIRDVPYAHTYKLFEKLTGKESL